MALSTQIILLCLCSFVADSFLFDILDTHHDPDNNPFFLFSKLFNPTPRPVLLHYQNFLPVEERTRLPITYDVTTARIEQYEPSTTTTELPTATSVEENIDDIYVDRVERTKKEDPYFMKNVKVSEVIDESEKDKYPEPNALSVHGDITVKPEPILSITLPHEDKKESNSEIMNAIPISDITESSTETSYKNDVNNPDLSKNSDFLVIPVNAVNLETQNTAPVDNTNNLNANSELVTTNNQPQGYQVLPNSINNQNAINPIPYNYQPNLYNTANGFQNPTVYGNISPNQMYSNQPNQYQGGNVPYNNLFMVNNPPNAGNNIGFQGSNGQQMYNLVPLNNMAQNMAGSNQQQNLVMLNNQLYTVVPLNNQPSNFNNLNPANLPYGSNMPQNYVPWNGNNFLPINNQPTNFFPVSNTPNNFIPLNNQAMNYIPISNPPNNFVPINNQPNNFLPINNTPNNFVPVNNVPSNYVPINGNLPANTGLTGATPENNQLSNENIVNNNVPVQPATNSMSTTRDKEDDEEDEKKENIESIDY